MTYQDQLHLQRHGQYERKFSKAFQRVLKLNYYEIARNLEQGRNLAEIDSEPMQKVYTRLYLQIMATEGPLIWNDLVAPLTGQEIKQKDIFDEVANIFSPDKMSEMRGFWNRLMTGYLNTYVIQRVTEVMGTTIKRTTEFIERQRNGGLTDKEIARMLRADARARELRANTIARTEATNAMSKAQILALESSGLQWEKAWRPIIDDKTRPSHIEMIKVVWIGIKEYFTVGGFPMSYPGDSTQGSPPNQTIGCRCRLAFRLAGRSFGFRPVQRRT